MSVDAQKQAIPIFTIVVALIGIGVVLQLWLLSASLEGALTQKGDVAIGATAASVVLFLLNGGLLTYALGVDRRVRSLNAAPRDLHTTSDPPA